MGKTSSKLNSVKNKVSLNKNLDNISKNDSTGNGFLQGNTSLEEIKQKCDPSKLVQTSLIKNEPVKRNAKDTSAKKSKKPCFVPPISASHLTSKDVPLNHHTINVLDDVNANQVLQKLNTEKINNIVTTVTFREGYTLLNKPEEQKKNSRCFPSGVMHMLAWESGRQCYYWLPLSDPAAITPAVVKLVDTLMSKSERNICFEAQAVYMLLMDMLKLKEIHNWDAYDPLIASWLLDPDNPPKDFKEISDKLNMDKNLLVVNPQANTKDQACDLLPVLDVAMNILQNRLVNTSLWTVFTDMETKLIPILAMMESSSILVDMKKLHRTAEAMDKKLRKLQSEAHKLADRWFQLNSPQQLREILFDKLKLDEKFNLKVKKTEHGEKSTSETVLEQMKELHPLPKIILEYRRLQKLKSTYVEGLLQHVKSDGTIGTSWEQVSASTGRITSKNPNLQAFPKCPIDVQDGETVNLREMFIAREGCSFLAADFQQIEFRVFAHFTQDRSLLQAFSEGGDIFQRLAERWLGGKGEEEREKTKRIVYSVMYGAGANKLSEYLHVEPTEAYKIIDNFVAIFPSLRSLPRTVIAKCRTQGFVSALSGRRRLFPNIRSTNGKLRSYSERQAMNFLIQGSAADICKAAMLDCEAEIRSRGLRAKLLLMIHDELIWEVDDRDLQETSKTVKLAMEHRWNERLTLLVPIPVCVSTGKTLANMQ
ncbi:DNA polymerase nu-like [Macrosteles quadrilineatus]|uniref:DNA polymerase nu-like n=1 Tax=Macrosteles quadrilineatus TaxID=74068 RepID=UPI0023E1494A|nr:DNA polymerase nu-like [Macrosteles quadrilineatus]